MPGRMGGKATTVKSLTVVDIDEDQNIVTISGAIPGSPNSFVIITKTAEGKRSDLEKETVKLAEKGADVPAEEGEGEQSKPTEESKEE